MQFLLLYYRLALQKEQFLKKKETLVKEIQTKKNFLDSLQPELANILKVNFEIINISIISAQCYMNSKLEIFGEGKGKTSKSGLFLEQGPSAQSNWLVLTIA